MNPKSILTLFIILLLTGGAAYGVIWFTSRKKTGGTGPGNLDPGTGNGPGTIDIGDNKQPLPKINSYGWWANKIGHASFPLKYGSRGVEVLKMQEGLNRMVRDKGWGSFDIARDGIWGQETQTRLNLLFPGTIEISEPFFAIYFDPEKEIIK